jgi:hypothetical protein
MASPPAGSEARVYAGETMKKAALIATSLLFALWLTPTWADDAATHYNMGLQLKRQGKISDAIVEVEKAIQLRSDYGAAHFTLGNLWRTQGITPRRRPLSSGPSSCSRGTSPVAPT